jgi:hypothetical protein
MNVVMRINKYLTANVALQTIYDDNSVQAVSSGNIWNRGITASKIKKANYTIKSFENFESYSWDYMRF